jgi:hypothetical protein
VAGIVVAWTSGNLGAGLLSAIVGAIAGSGSALIGADMSPKGGQKVILYILPIALPIAVAITASGLLSSPDQFKPIAGTVMLILFFLWVSRSR